MLIAVVDAVGPAVVSISAGKNQGGVEADQAGAGSGVVSAPDGYILTTDHVVQKANRLRVSDIIATINQVDVESVDDLHRFLAEWPIGQPVEIDVIRGQRHQILEVTPREAGV